MTTQQNIIPGAEAFFFSGNSTGILICHGFNGTPQSMEHLGRKFSTAGFTVHAPRLKGHGTSEYEMESCCYMDWINNLEDAYHQLKQTCSKIFIVGQSMGGALALDLAGKVEVDGIIAINAALKVPDLEPYKYLDGPRFIIDDKPDIHDPLAKEITYPKVPLTAVQELLSLMDISKQGLKHVTCPLLLFYSPEDHVVPAQCSFEIYHLSSSTDKQIVALNESYHVASLDYDKDTIAETAIHFIKNHCSHSLAS